MTRAARWAYPILAWAFVLGLVLQVFFIGLGLFAGRENVELHIAFGWLLHLAPLLVLLAAVLSRAGRRHWTWALGLVAVMFFVPILPILRDASPVVAALHPVLALAAFWVAVVVARQSLEVVRRPTVREPALAEVSL
jgi:hypothetical protein